MTGVVVQVRLGSTRLPGKALLPLGGSTLTDMVLARLAAVRADRRLLATDGPSAAELAPIAARRGFELVVGPTHDVLARYCIAAREAGLDLVLRATGDNPLVSHEAAALLLERRAAMGELERPDYSAYEGLPVGMGVEAVAAEALFRAEREAREPGEREHVCPYLYGHPELFTIDRPAAPAAYRLAGARVTVDTRADYDLVLGMYEELYAGEPIPTLLAIDWLRSRTVEAGARTAEAGARAASGGAR